MSSQDYKRKKTRQTNYFDFEEEEEAQGGVDLYKYKKKIRAAGGEDGGPGKHVYDPSKEEVSTGRGERPSDWGVYKVDAGARLHKCHVYEDHAVTLNQTDVGYGELGHNKFYIMQLLETNGGNKWYTYYKWGRVGAKHPADQLVRYSSLVEALAAFKKQFRRKTLNDWAHRRTHFKPQPGKYRIVHVEADQAETAAFSDKRNRLKELLSRSRKQFVPKLEKEVGELMELVFDERNMERALREHNLDLAKCPLGMLSQGQVAEGYRLLKGILKLLVEGRGAGSNLSGILPLSNEFYSLIPHDFGMKRPPPIALYAHVKQKIELLDLLTEVHRANAALLGSL